MPSAYHRNHFLAATLDFTTFSPDYYMRAAPFIKIFTINSPPQPFFGCHPGFCNFFMILSILHNIIWGLIFYNYAVLRRTLLCARLCVYSWEIKMKSSIIYYLQVILYSRSILWTWYVQTYSYSFCMEPYAAPHYLHTMHDFYIHTSWKEHSSMIVF